MKRLVGFLGALLVLAAASSAQTELAGTQTLAFDRPESWAMKYFASVNLLTGLGAPRPAQPGSVELGFEAASVPSLSEAERTVGFAGTKTEDLNKTSLFGRPRVRFGLPNQLSLVLSYVPPVELFDVRSHLVAVALERPLYSARRWRLGARLAGQYGTLKGDFTCSVDDVAAGDDRQRNPFGCEEPSRDEMTIRSASLELTAAWMGHEPSRFEPYLAVAGHRMNLDFQVGARYSGIVDRTLLLTDGSTLSLTGGVTYRLTENWILATELFYSPLDVVRPPAHSTSNDALLNVRSFLSWSMD
jgi:hypothetical protein